VHDTESRIVRSVPDFHEDERCGFCANGRKGQTWVKDEGDKNASQMYVKAYLEPTFKWHATSYGLGTRLRDTEEGGDTFNDTTPKETRDAVFYGHNLILRLLGFQNGYFNLGLDTDIQERISMFPKIWGRGE
jgi:hypothetical protein